MASDAAGTEQRALVLARKLMTPIVDAVKSGDRGKRNFKDDNEVVELANFALWAGCAFDPGTPGEALAGAVKSNMGKFPQALKPRPTAGSAAGLRCLRIATDGAADAVEAALASAHALAQPVVVSIGSAGDRIPTLSFRFPHDRPTAADGQDAADGQELAKIARDAFCSTLAPLVLTESDSNSERAESSEKSPFHHAWEVSFRLLPQPDGGDRQRAAEPTTFSLIERLAVASLNDWEVEFHLEPLNDPSRRWRADNLITPITELLQTLAGYGQQSYDATGGQVTTTNALMDNLERTIRIWNDHLVENGSLLWKTWCRVRSADEHVGRAVLHQVLAEHGCDGSPGRLEPRPHEIVENGADLAWTSLLTSTDVVALLRPPGRSVPGIEMVRPFPGGRVAEATDTPLELGWWLGAEHLKFQIELKDLVGHAFITGTTGSGKSVTAQAILAELVGRNVPFLVIDPVKADYEKDLKNIGLNCPVYSARELRLNVLSPYPGFPAALHLELLNNIFRGSFAFPVPVPFILTRLLDGLADRIERTPQPTLHDVRERFTALLPELGYSAEIEGNIRGILGTRFDALLSPSRGERVASSNPMDLDDLLTKPAIVELSALGDDDERSFLASVLALYVYERARTRTRDGDPVQHITVIEEAHRIMPERAPAGPESSDPSAVTSAMFGQLLAEVRSLGESFIIVDQSPHAVSREVLRNTNLKIMQRVVDPNDQNTAAGALGLREEHAPVLGDLRQGEALVSRRSVSGVHAIKIRPPRQLAEGATPDAPSGPMETRDTDMERRQGEAVHRAEIRGSEAERLVALSLLMALMELDVPNDGIGAPKAPRSDAPAGVVGRPTDAESMAASRSRWVSLYQQVRAAEADRLPTDLIKAWHGLVPGGLQPGELDSQAAVRTGARRVVGFLADQKVIDSAQTGPVADELAEAIARNEFPREVARRIAERLRPDRPDMRPFPGCDACSEPCVVRPFVLGGSLARYVSAGRQSLVRDAGNRLNSAKPYEAVKQDLNRLIGDNRVSDTVALCVSLHALDREGITPYSPPTG